MKKILSKVLIAISVFNGVNVSTGAMEENPVNLLNLQTGVSNSWKEWAKNERKRITAVVDKLIQKEWEWRRHFRVNLQYKESWEENCNYDNEVADACSSTCLTGEAIIPNLDKDWEPIDDYEKYFEQLSWPYLFYGRGVCRNKAAWVLRTFLRSNIFARIVTIKCPSENNNNGGTNHVVVLYRMPDENSEDTWNYYIADLQFLSGHFNNFISDWPDPVFSLPQDLIQSYRDQYMQIPLKEFLNLEDYGYGDVGFIVEFVCKEPDFNHAQILEQINSDFNKESDQINNQMNSDCNKAHDELNTKKNECDKKRDERIKLCQKKFDQILEQINSDYVKELEQINNQMNSDCNKAHDELNTKKNECDKERDEKIKLCQKKFDQILKKINFAYAKELKQIIKQFESDRNKAYDEFKTKMNECDKKRDERLKLHQEMFDQYKKDLQLSCPFTLGDSCAKGEITKEDASKRGVTDLTMWCQKNCPEVLE